MKNSFQKIGNSLIGVFCFSFLAALVIPLAVWIITYLFLGFSELIKLNVAFLYPVYIIIGIALWLRYSRDKSFIIDTSLEKIGVFMLSVVIYSVSIAFIFLIMLLSINFILSLFTGEQYNLFKWFYDLSENSRFALIITVGILFQILFPYDWEKKKSS